jgi:hypothetical protein
MVMDELDFVKAQLARSPTRRDQAFTPLLIMVLTGGTAALVVLWFQLVLAPLPYAPSSSNANAATARSTVKNCQAGGMRGRVFCR